MVRHGAVRRRAPPHPEHRRRHAVPLRDAVRARRRRQRLQHHLQGPLQRRRRDDRRAGPVRSARRAGAGDGLPRRGRHASHRHHRRPSTATAACRCRRVSRCGTAAGIVEAQELLATVPGHDRADPRPALRRREPRATASATSIATPTQRVVIDERVCEGCGDCGDVSNCLSVQPVDTPFGRKTRIDQASCNLDFSCLKGDCPSFMTVEPASGSAARVRRSSSSRRGSARRRGPRRDDRLDDAARRRSWSSTATSRPSGSAASVAPASSPSARSSAPRRCSTASTSAASTRPACRRRPGRSSATSASPATRRARRTRRPTGPSMR